MTYVKRKPFFRLILRAAPAAGAVALAAVLCTTSARGADANYLWPVTRVIDGDTVAVKVPGLPPELTEIRVRLRGVDTPEKGWRAKCEEERVKGKAATDFTRMQIDVAKRNDSQIVVRNPKWGKYGGRVIADLVLDGKTLSDLLKKAGHGRPYSHGKRPNWCPDSES